MKREDLRSRIIPTILSNTDESQKKGNGKFNTSDLIYLDSDDDQFDNQKKNEERKVSATDYAQMNNAIIYNDYTTRIGRPTTGTWRRSAFLRYFVYYVRGDGEFYISPAKSRNVGLCPSLHYHLPSDISARKELQSTLRLFKWKQNIDENEEPEQFDIREVKDQNRKNYISYIANW